MTISQIKELVSMMKIEEYELLCDNGIILYHDKKHPVGFFKTNDGAEFIVRLKPATIDTVLIEKSKEENNSKIVQRFTTIIVPAEHVQYLQAKSTKEQFTPIINAFMAKGAYSAEQGEQFKNSKELFGIKEYKAKKDK